MKKISLIDVLLVFLILAIIGISIFLFLLLRKSVFNSKNTPVLIPTTSLFGKVSEIKGDSIFFIPNSESLSLLKKTGISNNSIYEAKLNKNTLMTKIYSIPYISPEGRSTTNPVNIVSKDIFPNDSVNIETTSDLSQHPKETIVAKTITVYSNPFFISGRIDSVQSDSVKILSQSANTPTEEVIKTLQVLITPKTEIGYKSASVSGIIQKEELSINDFVIIFSFDNPDTSNTITAETITVKKF